MYVCVCMYVCMYVRMYLYNIQYVCYIEYAAQRGVDGPVCVYTDSKSSVYIAALSLALL